jgi:hypothetical protein
MSVLRNIEAKIEGVVQGAFSRAFKSNVQPVELARKLDKEMEEHKSVSISRVYVPNEYNVFLSLDDRAQFEGYEAALTKELSDYLLEHARNEGLALVTRPVISFMTDERLTVGEFGIQSVLAQPPEEEGGESPQADFGHTMVYSPDRAPRPLEDEAPARQPAGKALLVGEGRRRILSGDAVVLGRSRNADIVLEDPNVSRKHAELRREDGRWAIADLGSTNGVKVNGRRVEQAYLEPGDEIVLGTSSMQFEVE